MNSRVLDLAQDTSHFLNKKTLDKKLTMDNTDRVATLHQEIRGNDLQKEQGSDPQNPSVREKYTELDALLASFKDSHDILDQVLVVMILLSNNSADRAQSISDQLQTVLKDSRELKKAADGLQAYKDYIAKLQQEGNMGPYTIDAETLNDPENGLQALKTALTDLGGWKEDGSVPIDEAMKNMTTTVTQDMYDVDNTTTNNVLSDDTDEIIKAMMGESTDPTGSITDYYNKLDTSQNSATTVNQTKSAQLQGATNNYQMQLSMATSFLQRMQDLNSKITSLT